MTSVRNRRIDVIRGISILLVLFHHFNIAYPLYETSLSQIVGWRLVRAVARNGNFGVTMFFVISGYLITTNALRRSGGLANISLRWFYGLRAARIIPCLVLLVAIVNGLALSGVAIFQNHGALSFWLVNAAALTGWMNVLIEWDGWTNYALGVLWSLSVEEAFYLAFPILCLILRREVRLLVFFAVIILIGPLYRLAHQGDEAGYLYAYFAAFDGIAIGCGTALLLKRRLLPEDGEPWLQRGVAVGMVAVYLFLPIGQTNVLSVTAMALGTGICLLGPSRPAGRLRFFSGGLAWLGRLSYELYLFHLIVLGLLQTVFPPRAAWGDWRLLLLVAFLTISAGLAVVISRVYSEPLNRRLRMRWRVPISL